MENIVRKISQTLRTNTQIDPELFKKYNVKRGLRNEDYTGVIVGLTKVGDVVGYRRTPEGLIPVPGKLIYRGFSLEDVVRGAQEENRLGFEETIFLILSGYLPSKTELDEFSSLLSRTMDLNQRIIMHILDLEGKNIMNILARCVLELYIFDDTADDTSEEKLVEQSLNLIASFPTIIAYAYSAMMHHQGHSLHIRYPKPHLSLAENFLYLMKGDNYTQLDVKVLDQSLMVHADHGGGNNSAFTVRVTSSAGTDTYSAISSGIASLNGPLHGGANKQVVGMMQDIKDNVKDWTNAQEVDRYLKAILDKKAYNQTGLIYGIGHAIYTISDPRTVLLKERARELATEKGREEEFSLYCLVEELGIANLMERRKDKGGKQVCANVDFYSGFIYDMIGLPTEIYTPLFAMARIVGWCAHRIEELNFKERRIIRPAYMNANITGDFTYCKMCDRK